MGTIKIIDTGFIKPDNTGTQASSNNMSNSGNEITINTGRFVPSLSRNISAQSRLSSNRPAEVNLGSLENMQFQLSCVLNVTDNSDMETASHLLDLISTNGYKLLWYNYSNATTEDNNGQLIYRVATNGIFGHQLTSGEATFWSLSSQFYHLHVLFNDIQMTQSAKSTIQYTLNGIVLPVPNITNTPE